MLTDEGLLVSKPHPMGGEQRIYRWAKGRGLSLVNCPRLHNWEFAWEAAVLRNVSDNGSRFDLTYETELSGDVEVFDNDEQANEFIARAAELFA
jgi:hypothetical protein